MVGARGWRGRGTNGWWDCSKARVAYAEPSLGSHEHRSSGRKLGMLVDSSTTPGTVTSVGTSPQAAFATLAIAVRSWS